MEPFSSVDNVLLHSCETVVCKLKKDQAKSDDLYDTFASEENSIVIAEDNLDELEETYAEDYPELWHVLEEFHYLLCERYISELPNPKGYLSISATTTGLDSCLFADYLGHYPTRGRRQD